MLKKKKGGFTLLEMLVVVLIIGILAGIALPQYTKSVEKTRLAEFLISVSSIQKAVDLYTLNNGYPSSGREYIKFEDLDIDITQGYDNCNSEGCSNKYFNILTPSCTVNNCDIEATRFPPANSQEDWSYYLTFSKSKESEEWTKGCTSDEDREYICKYLESLGFENRGTC